VPKDVQRLKLKAKLCQDIPDAPDDGPEDESASPKNFDSVDASMRRAVEGGDHRGVVRCWNTFKQLEQAPTARLAQIVESMQCTKKDAQSIIR